MTSDDNNWRLTGMVLVVTILAGCGGGGSSGESCGNLPDIQVREIAPALDGSGDIYVGGYFTKYDKQSRNFLVRINRNGSLDKDFDIKRGFNSTVLSITPATDGSGDVYLGGAFTLYNFDIPTNNIARLNSDGSLDRQFAAGDGFADDFNAVLATTLAPDGSGDIYVGGNFGKFDRKSASKILRLNSDGSRDYGFAIDNGFSAGYGGVESIAPSSDGSGDIYIVGIFESYNGLSSKGIIRLNSNGTPDLGFASGDGFDSWVYDVAAATDGSEDVYVGGWFSRYNNRGPGRLIRINSDGSVDKGFDTHQGISGRGISCESARTSTPCIVRTVAPAVDGSGDVYVGGSFSNFDGRIYNNIVRINSDGTRDTDFDVGNGLDDGFNDWVNTIALAADNSGDVYVGGRFTSYRGEQANRIIRLNSDGSRDSAFRTGNGITGCRPAI